MTNYTDILIALVVIGLIIARRFAGREVSPRRYAIVPLVFIVYGATLIGHAGHPSGTDVKWMIISGIFSVAAGMVRGTTISLYEKNGVLWQKYRVSTLVLWIATIAIRFGLDALAVHDGAVSGVMTASALMMFGVSLAAESLTVLPRAWAHGTPMAVRA